jgi:pimeloyl-ACP methyl ester carboxylesterase
VSLTARVNDWQARGERARVLAQHNAFVVRRRGAGPTILMLHGFPSSSYDWRALLETEPMRERDVLAFDFLGFGLSDKPPGRNSLLRQADVTEELVERYTSGSVFLVAHDMGTSVSTELLARQLDGRLPFEITGSVLFNGSMLLHLATLTLGQKLLRTRAGPLLARLSSERFFRQQLGSVFSPAHPMSAEEGADQWSLLAHAGGDRRGHDLIAYQDERERYAERWHGAIRDWPGPLSLLWGMKDPVATVDVLRGLQQLRPGVPGTELADLGHYPQIEDPATVAAYLAQAVPASSAPTAEAFPPRAHPPL